MKKIAFLMTAMLTFVSLSLISCKDEPVAPDTSAEETFVGDYNITLVTDSVGVDDQLYSLAFYTQITGKTEPERYGTMNITSSDNVHFNISLEYAAEGSSTVYAFTTTGMLNANNQLVVEPCEAQVGNVDFTLSLRPIAMATPLVFHSEAMTRFAGMDCRYLMTVTAEKK